MPASILKTSQPSFGIPDLKQAGYRVNFQEFDGPHAMPPEIARGAIEWFLK